ncbi:MAG: cysteine desulfurase [Acidobacteria bacterium]|nr:cysteine desulfurase [Acidobacteriota bacterium]
MRAYFDHNATTPIEPVVLDAMLPYLRHEFGNASSIHTPGQRARAAVERARTQTAALIGAHSEEIIFTSGGTESDNLAILGVARANRSSRRHIITTAIEHHAVLHPCRALGQKSFDVTYLSPDQHGFVTPESLRAAIRPETLLVSIMHANNETGAIQPIAELAAIAHRAGSLFHTDAVQSAGKIPTDVPTLGVDLLSLSAHKFYGPKGVGALFLKTGVALEPLLHGGHNFGEPRPGTENVAGIVGLGAAAQFATKHMQNDAVQIRALRDQIESTMLREFPRDICLPNFPLLPGAESDGARMPNTTNFSFQGVDGEAMVIALDLSGFSCSTGSACSSGTVEPSHVLLALGRSPQMARGGLRISLGRHNTNAEVDSLARVLIDAVRRLRALSPDAVESVR